MGSRKAWGGRMPPPHPYHVTVQGGAKVHGVEYEWWVQDGRWRAVAAVYHRWSRRFLFTMGLWPLRYHYGDRSKWGEAIMSFLERSRPQPASNGAAKAPVCKWLAKAMPAVHEFLTVAVMPSGEVRQTSTLSVFVDDGIFKVCLHERDMECTLWASGDGLEEALEVLEERLTAPVVEWRRKGGKAPPGRDRRK